MDVFITSKPRSRFDQDRLLKMAIKSARACANVIIKWRTADAEDAAKYPTAPGTDLTDRLCQRESEFAFQVATDSRLFENV